MRRTARYKHPVHSCDADHARTAGRSCRVEITTKRFKAVQVDQGQVSPRRHRIQTCWKLSRAEDASRHVHSLPAVHLCSSNSSCLVVQQFASRQQAVAQSTGDTSALAGWPLDNLQAEGRQILASTRGLWSSTGYGHASLRLHIQLEPARLLCLSRRRPNSGLARWRHQRVSAGQWDVFTLDLHLS